MFLVENPTEGLIRLIGNARLRETVGNFRSGVPVFLVAFNSLGPGKR